MDDEALIARAKRIYFQTTRMYPSSSSHVTTHDGRDYAVVYGRMTVVWRISGSIIEGYRLHRLKTVPAWAE